MLVFVLRIGFTLKIFRVVNAWSRGGSFANSISRAEVSKVAELVARDAGKTIKESDFLGGCRSIKKTGRAHIAKGTDRDRLANGDSAHVSGLIIPGLISIWWGALYV